MTEPKHILFTNERLSKSGKTNEWLVCSKYDQTDVIGQVKWFGRWRCYGFFPFKDTVFEKQCLRDIADFCEEQTKHHRLLTTPIHAHTAQFGSELWCKKCNPYCHDKHAPSMLTWCGHPKCPMNPASFSVKEKAK